MARLHRERPAGWETPPAPGASLGVFWRSAAAAEGRAEPRGHWDTEPLPAVRGRQRAAPGQARTLPRTLLGQCPDTALDTARTLPWTLPWTLLGWCPDTALDTTLDTARTVPGHCLDTAPHRPNCDCLGRAPASDPETCHVQHQKGALVNSPPLMGNT